MKIEIIKIEAVGRIFEDLLPGQIHVVIEPPKKEKRKWPNNEYGVWIMGKHGPIRLLSGKGRDNPQEYKIIEP